jgi:hypothetical protein
MTATTTKKIIEVPTSLIHKRINKTPMNRESIEGMTRDNDKMVTGTFVNIESPGQTAKISGKYYKGMEYFTRVFHDDERATIPLSVARFINERCKYFKHSHILDDKGQPIKEDKPYPRYKFMIESM